MTNNRHKRVLNSVKSLLNFENFLKVFYRPYKIPSFLKNLYLTTKRNYTDIKFKPQTHEEIISIYEKSINGLSVLSTFASGKKLKIFTIDEIIGKSITDKKFTKELCNLFNEYGSDKSTTHNYYLIYAYILENSYQKSLNILEIGLGTNNLDVLSNMGAEGKPGASLRAFRDACPHSSIYGADVDKRILFEEDRIKTFYIDQTNPETFVSLKNILINIQFDLIIDDGLHNSEANINTINFALPLLSDDGVLIIEDINIKDFNYYQIISSVLENKYNVRFINTKSACMCIINKNKPT